MSPLAIDLYCGLGGFTEGLLAEGYFTVGFDIERHIYGEHRYPAQLVLQDVRTIHGSQFKDAALIVASPPCQEFSYMAMPWKRAKQMARALRGEDEFPEGYTGSRTIAELTALFDACFRIQREACEAAGRHIPMVVENVCGAQKWVGRARWNFGSFYLWGDVPALMPITLGRPPMKAWITHRNDGATNFNGYKTQGMNRSDQTKRGQDFTRIAGKQAIKTPGRSMSKGVALKWGTHNTGPGSAIMAELGNGIKCGGDWFNASQPSISRMASSKSSARKFASAMIARIPPPLSRHIAATYNPKRKAA